MSECTCAVLPLQLPTATHVRICDQALQSVAKDLAQVCSTLKPGSEGLLPIAEWDWDVHFFDGNDLTVQVYSFLAELRVCVRALFF